jgi:hypothetical protein
MPICGGAISRMIDERAALYLMKRAAEMFASQSCSKKMD